jgi:chemotaxis protein CheD
MAAVHVVGISDCKLSGDPSDTVVTYGLGSCIGLVLYDRSVTVGGILHILLPDSLCRSRSREFNPYMYADTGIAAFLESAIDLGVQKSRLVAKVAGGSKMLRHPAVLDIGKRNAEAVLHHLAREGIPILAKSLGGTVGRSMQLELRDGSVSVRLLGSGREQL